MKPSIQPHMIRRHAIGFATLLCLGLNGALASDKSPAAPANAPAATSLRKPVISKLGFMAQAVPSALAEEGCRDTLIKKVNQPAVRVPNAVPVSFSPDGRILLLADAIDGDDSRHFLLNVGAGEEPKAFGQRRQIGGRYVKSATWSDDGKTLTLHSKEGLSDKPEETIEVADYLTKTSK